MMLTINRLQAEDIRHFAMVHDSFGVHACDIDLLHHVLRDRGLAISNRRPPICNIVLRFSISLNVKRIFQIGGRRMLIPNPPKPSRTSTSKRLIIVASPEAAGS
jgi:hypothetical protein